MSASYQQWLEEHLAAAKARYTELSELDDRAEAENGSSEYYEQAHQMFGYIAALEKCLREVKASDRPKRSR
jgi:hypothetical protein